MAKSYAARSRKPVGKLRSRNLLSTPQDDTTQDDATQHDATLSPAVASALFNPAARDSFAVRSAGPAFPPIEFEKRVQSATSPECKNENRVQGATPTESIIENHVPSATAPHHTAPSDQPATGEGASSAHEQLSPQQQAAAAALVLGGSISASATNLNIDIELLRHWLRTDPLFSAAMTEIRQEMIVEARQKLLALSEEAITVIENQLEKQGEAVPAVRFLRHLGILGRQAQKTLYRAPYPLPPDTAVENLPAHKNGVQSATTAQQAATSTSPLEKAFAAKAAAAREPATQHAEAPLTTQQNMAITILGQGHSLAEAAQQLKIPVAKLRHWLRTHESFGFALAEQHIERMLRLRNQLWGLVEKASACIKTALAGGNHRLAMTLMHDLGLLC